MGKEQGEQTENVQTEAAQSKKTHKSKTGQTVQRKDNTVKWIIVAVVVEIVAFVIIGVVGVNGPSYKAHQALRLGERYLAEMDYERAVVQFIVALELDPRDEEIVDAIYGHLGDLLIVAQGYGESNDYSAERQIAALVLRFDTKNDQGELPEDSLLEERNGQELFERANALIWDADKRELIDQGNQAFEEGRYTDATEKYEQAIEKGATKEDVSPELSLCGAYLNLLNLCEKSNWQGVANYIDSVKFDPIADYIDIANPQNLSRDVNISISKKDDCYIVVTRDLTADGTSGYGTAVISSANTYAIYEGEWKDNVPNGDGILRVWYKNQAMKDGIQYSGSFENGSVSGEAVLNVLVDGTTANLDITVSSGSVQVFTTDEEGRVWLYDVADKGTYTYIIIVDNVKESNGAVADYIAGVPGYGGSDDIISVCYVMSDAEPPVLKCSLERNVWLEGEIPIGKGVTATDNVDGDITNRITNTSAKGQTDWQKREGYGYNEREYKLTVVYSATDAVGNVGTLTVVYEFQSICNDTVYRVVSVN